MTEYTKTVYAYGPDDFPAPDEHGFIHLDKHTEYIMMKEFSLNGCIAPIQVAPEDLKWEFRE